jgi:hypothetical protein
MVDIVYVGRIGDVYQSIGGSLNILNSCGRLL